MLPLIRVALVKVSFHSNVSLTKTALNIIFHPRLLEISEQVIRYPALVGTLSQLICSQIFLNLPQIFSKTLHAYNSEWLTQGMAIDVLLGWVDRLYHNLQCKAHRCYK